MSPSQFVYRAAQVRELDRQSIEEHGIPGLCLMERAGWACFQLLQQHWPQRRCLSVVCGVGNNAGDGYVLARLAAVAGYQVQVLQLGEVERLRGDALRAFQYWQALGGTVQPFSADLLSGDENHIIADAIFGTGLDREVSGAWAEAIAAINAQPCPVLAIDIPSGLHADTGAVLGIAVQADATPSFIGLKPGLFTGAGAAHCGLVSYHDLSAPAAVFASQTPAAQLIDAQSLSTSFPPRRRDAHKGDFGHVLIIGGEQGYSGAARLAAEAAARCGAGKVSLATRQSHAALLNLDRPEIMCHPIETAEELRALMTQVDAFAIGPGLGKNVWGQTMLAVAREFDLPCVVDADALNLLAEDDNKMPWPQSIFTPHPGEAGRLLGCSTADIQQDRFAVLAALGETWQNVCVLKGAGSLIAAPDKLTRLCTAGNPGMACGGMGDVLSGVIAALLGQGFAPADAAALGVTLHAVAADQAAAEQGERGLLPSDLYPHLRRLLNPQA